MKKTFKIIIPILVLSLLGYLVYNVISKMQYKSEVAKTLQTIPEFSFKTLENEEFTNTDLKPNTATVFIYFNSECDFCQHEAKNISENIDQFKNIQFLFVSTEDIGTIKTFAKTYNLISR